MKSEKDILDHLKARKIERPSSDYFANLAKQISDSQSAPAKIIPLYRRKGTWISIAAAAAVVLLVFQFIPESGLTPSNPMTSLSIDDLSSEEITAYVEKHIDEFDIDMIIDQIPLSNLENDPVEETIEPNDSTEFQNINTTIDTGLNFDDIDIDDILQYFESEGIDIEELENEEDILI